MDQRETISLWGCFEAFARSGAEPDMHVRSEIGNSFPFNKTAQRNRTFMSGFSQMPQRDTTARCYHAPRSVPEDR
jgi:hypothetical protein